MSRLAETLLRVRHSEGLTSQAFAKKLGVSQASLTLFAQGKRQAGLKILRAILRTYPEMAFAVHEYIARGDGQKEE